MARAFGARRPLLARRRTCGRGRANCWWCATQLRPRSSDERSVHRRRRRWDEDRRRRARGRRAPGVPRSSPTEQASQEALVDQIAAAIEASLTLRRRAVGIGMPSVIEFATGRILASVNIPLHDIPLRELLTERMGVPVYVENDAGCAALAEAFEDGRMTTGSLVMFTIGTGVGGGWVLNGRLYRGATTSAAEVGHTIIGRDLAERRSRGRGPVPAARLAGDAGLGPGVGPAGGAGRDPVPRLLPGPAARREGRDRRPRRRRRRRVRRRRARCMPARARRADRDRDRERDQHLRPARGRDRRRRLARRRPAARARPATPPATSCRAWG